MIKLSRNLNIKDRKKDTKEFRKVKRYDYSLDEIFNEFDQNIDLIKQKFEVTIQLKNAGDQSTAKDIYRFQIVFLEGALDYFLHRLGMYAMKQMYEGSWNKSTGYRNIKVPINDVIDAIQHPEKTKWVDSAIISYHSSRTYMSPNGIKELLKLIGQDFFDEISKELSPEIELETILKKIFDRRNRIVHQLDCDHKTGLPTDIQKSDVERYIAAIEQFVKKLYDKLNK